MLHDLVRGFADTRGLCAGATAPGPGGGRGHLRGRRVLELGAGTGLLSRALVDAGLDVVALEPLAAMRAQLVRAIGAERVLAGRAEAIPLADGSVDGTAASDAFHWFDGPPAAAELHRVVRPGGGVVVCVTDGAGADSRPAWELALGAVLDELRDAAGHPHARGPRRPEALAEHGGFTDIRHRSVPFTHATDRDGMVAYVASMAFVGVLPARRRAEVLARVGAILDRHGVACVELRMTAELWLTRRRPGPARPPGRTAAG